MTAVDGLGYVAAILVLATFCAKSMVPLRVLAIASNLAFIAYGYCAGLWPILALHTVMLPLNLLRLCEALAKRKPKMPRKVHFLATGDTTRTACNLAVDSLRRPPVTLAEFISHPAPQRCRLCAQNDAHGLEVVP
jgi:hypothetical protein